MSMARNTSKSVTAKGWHHEIRQERHGRTFVLVCEAWNHHGDCIEVTGSDDQQLRFAALGAIEQVEAEAKAGCAL
jgi:hypothetical protein